MNRKLRNVGILVGILLIIVGFSFLSDGQVFIEYSLNGFTQIDTATVNSLTLGYDFPFFTQDLDLTIAFDGDLAQSNTTVSYYYGIRLDLMYGTLTEYARFHFAYSVPTGFVGSLGFRVTLPSFFKVQTTGGP